MSDRPHKFAFVMDDGSEVQATRWKNRDGSPGGWVADNAQVHPTAIIEELAIVQPMSVIGEGEHVFGQKPKALTKLEM